MKGMPIESRSAADAPYSSRPAMQGAFTIQSVNPTSFSITMLSKDPHLGAIVSSFPMSLEVAERNWWKEETKGRAVSVSY